jgi:hypothetical protein
MEIGGCYACRSSARWAGGGAVDAVLASDLGQQPAQLGGPLHGGAAGGRRDERAQALQRHLGRGHAEGDAGALQQPGALGLELGAGDHLALDLGQPCEDGLDVAGADRRALREHGAQQAARGRDLLVEVNEQLGFQDSAHGVTP